MTVRIHWPTLFGRVRADRGLLLLTGVVVALTSALIAAVSPLTTRTADKAVAESIREVGSGASLIATLPQQPIVPERRRQSTAHQRFALDVKFTRNRIPEGLASVVRPTVASLVSELLTVTGAGPRRSLRLVYVESPSDPPEVTWVAGQAPASSAKPGEEDIVLTEDEPPWPVQVGLSERAAVTLDVKPGAQVTALDRFGRAVEVVVSGVFSPDDVDDPAWTVARELLSPAVGSSDGVERTSVAALVSPEALPDLRVAVPPDQLTQRITFLPEPEQVRWDDSSALRRDVVELRTAPGLDSGQTGWDSALDRVLEAASVRIESARGRAQVPLIALLATTALTVILAAQLLARRRTRPLTLARERGATLLGIGAELAIESALMAVVAAAAGIGVTAAVLGSADGRWVLPVVVVAALAAPVFGILEAARATNARRTPANRAARRVIARRRQVRRLMLEGGLVAVAVLALVALRQRGPVSGDLGPASTPVLWALVGALALVRVLPSVVEGVLRRSARSAGPLPFFVAARVAAGGTRALPLAVIVVAVAQLVLSTSLAATQQRGQEAGAMLTVGGDARLDTAPGREVLDTAANVGNAPGVELAVAGRVADRTLASSLSTGASVRLVVVDASAYARLLAASRLPDAPQIERLAARAGVDEPVPALLHGGPAGLENGLRIRWGSDAEVALDVVGEAPQVNASSDPVVVVDATALAAAGVVADPNTIWAVGEGAPEALRSAAQSDPADTVQTYDAVLTRLRDAPLSAAQVHLAVAAALMLALLAGVGMLLGAALDAPARATALGRLRALGLAERELRRVMFGELLVPVSAGVLTGFAVGVATAWATFGSLGLEAVTGQLQSPRPDVPIWTWLAVIALLLATVVLARRQSRRLRRTNLAQHLRAAESP